MGLTLWKVSRDRDEGFQKRRTCHEGYNRICSVLPNSHLFRCQFFQDKNEILKWKKNSERDVFFCFLIFIAGRSNECVIDEWEGRECGFSKKVT